MRELIFRAWDTENKIMVSPFIKLHKRGLTNYCDYDSVYELMQYTGFKDRNGKEVYEGDIVTVLQTDDEEFVRKHEVQMLRGRWCYQRLFGNYEIEDLGCMFSSQPTSCRNTGLEVIGNIYENPELLEQPNEHTESA